MKVIKINNTETTILIRVPKNMKKELQFIALHQDTNISDIIRTLIADYIQQHNQSKNI